MAKSIMDYIFRWLASKFLSKGEQQAAGVIERETPETASPALPAAPSSQPALPLQGGQPGPRAKVFELKARDAGHVPLAFEPHDDAPSCSDCGSLMVRNGVCYKCLNCGSTSGCS